MQHVSTLFPAVRTFALAGLLISAAVGAQAQGSAAVTTGTAASAGYHPGPIYRSAASSAYYYSQYAYVFDAVELAAAGLLNGDQITGITWEKTNNATSTRTGLFQVLMKNSAVATYTTAATWASLTSGTTTVYNEAAFTVPGAIGPMPLPFTAPFAYTGQSLEVFANWQMATTGTGNASSAAYNWAQYSVPDKILGYCHSTTITASLSPTSNSIGTLTDLRPKTTFTYTRVTGARAQAVLSGAAYPNPTTGVLHLQLMPAFAGLALQATIMDATGRVVRDSRLSSTGELDMHQLPAGVYLVRVAHKGLTEVHRVQLQP